MHKVQYRLFRRRKPARQVLLLNLKKLGKVGAGVPFMTFHLRGARKNSAEIRSWLICPAPFKLMQTKLSNFRSWHRVDCQVRFGSVPYDCQLRSELILLKQYDGSRRLI